MHAVRLIKGYGGAGDSGATRVATGLAIRRAQRAGFRAGRRVRLGQVEGVIVGYNIGAEGRYPGLRYPLIVSTRFGLAKCGLDEASLA